MDEPLSVTEDWFLTHTHRRSAQKRKGVIPSPSILPALGIHSTTLLVLTTYSLDRGTRNSPKTSSNGVLSDFTQKRNFSCPDQLIAIVEADVTVGFRSWNSPL